MKATGIVRKLDDLGRVVIPMEIRKSFQFDEEGQPLEIFVEGNKIIMKKYAPGCALCGNMEGLKSHKSGKLVCGDCIE